MSVENMERVCHACWCSIKDVDGECPNCALIAKLQEESDAWRKVIGLAHNLGMKCSTGTGLGDVLNYVRKTKAAHEALVTEHDIMRRTMDSNQQFVESLISERDSLKNYLIQKHPGHGDPENVTGRAIRIMQDLRNSLESSRDRLKRDGEILSKDREVVIKLLCEKARQK